MALFRIPLHTQILIAMLLGVLSGLFFGEMMATFQPLGDAFIMLLKMTVLPYVSFSLIHAVGSLSGKEAVKLASRALLFFIGLWVITIATVYLVASSFPEQNSPIYYSDLSAHDGTQESLLSVFIPTNPIQAFANDMIPGVVLFSLLFGVALIQLKEKSDFLGNVRIVISSLMTITRWIAQLSPIGVFALITSATGSMPFAEMVKLKLYLVAYVLGIGLLTFVLFPLAVNSLTPVKAREFLRELRPAMILSFTTGNVLISLPYVIQGLEKIRLPHAKEEDDRTAANTIESMVPIAYNFPTVGNLFAILFILFLSFFYAQPISFGNHFYLIGLAIPVLFGPATSVINGVTFLSEKLHMPADGTGLFLETLSVTRNFQALGTTTGIATIALLLAFSCSGRLRVEWRRLPRNGVISVVWVALVLIISNWVDVGDTTQSESFSSLTLRRPVEHEIHRDGETAPKSRPPKKGVKLLEHIQKKGELRVGYNASNMPFCYFNSEGELVGFDIAYAHELARTLGVKLIFVPFSYGELSEALARGDFDIAMSSVSVTGERMRSVGFTDPYIEMERAFVVRDALRTEVADVGVLTEREDFRLCVVAGSSFEGVARETFSKATIIPLEAQEDFLAEGVGDALLWAQEEATTWSLIHPAYTVVIPSPTLGKEYYAFAVSSDQSEWLDWVNYWLHMKQRDGFGEEQHTYWVLGKRPQTLPRWSIIRDVLHWTD